MKFERKVSLGTAPRGFMLPKNPQDVLLLYPRNFYGSYEPAARVRKFSSGYDVKKMKDVWNVGQETVALQKRDSFYKTSYISLLLF